MIDKIFHNENLNLNGTCFHRVAVRAIVFNDKNEILMIYSKNQGDYKFPGGGVDNNETHERALFREVLEEAGLELKSVDNSLGLITEYALPKFEDVDYFVMESFYYRCTAKSFKFNEQNLDDYEADLGFEPVWIKVEDALSHNIKFKEESAEYPRWIIRENKFLEYLLGYISD